MSIQYKLALDVMSGERDPFASIDAAVEALKNDDALGVFLVGDENIITEHFPNDLMHRAEIIHTDQVVSMDESPVDALRKKKNSSMRLAINLVSEGKADACVSSGNTGALMANAKYVLKTLPTIDRPAFMKAIPTKGDYTYMLDLGANSSCTADQLYQFALMGNIVAREIKGISSPKVALLNIGEEEIKGHEMIKEASILLEDSSIKEGSQFALDIFKKSIDPRRHNGALLVGLNGIVVKSHGSSDSYGHYHALLTAIDEVKKEIIPKMIESFEK